MSDSKQPQQALRDQFAAAIADANRSDVLRLLRIDKRLANCDLREEAQRDQFTNGLPLVRACRANDEAIVELLLQFDAEPDAASTQTDDPPELGMPLHYAAVEHRNYRLAKLLLDSGASPNGHPYCAQSTIQCVFGHACEIGVSESIVRHAFSNFFPDRGTSETADASDLLPANPTEAHKLLVRMIDVGGQLPFCAVVREGFDDLLMETVEFSANKQGTPHDFPRSTVIDNVFGAARWHGYPRLVQRLMAFMGEAYSYDSAIETIQVAISSHNRDGPYDDYRRIIVMQLEYIKSIGKLDDARQDNGFKPLLKIATDFTWHSNYGYRAPIASPECYVDLGELFLEWRFHGVEDRDPETSHSPLSAAVQRGHHPGIEVYINWLLSHGADLRVLDPDDVNPLALATKNGLDEIHGILSKYSK